MCSREQRKRTKGWRAPANSIYIGRGSRYGNPYSVAEYGRDDAIWYFRCAFFAKPAAEQRAILDALRGKVLLCWCKPDEPCHGDVYLDLLRSQARWRERTRLCS